MYLVIGDFVVQASFLYSILEEYKMNSNVIIQNCITASKPVCLYECWWTVGSIDLAFDGGSLWEDYKSFCTWMNLDLLRVEWNGRVLSSSSIHVSLVNHSIYLYILSFFYLDDFLFWSLDLLISWINFPLFCYEQLYQQLKKSVVKGEISTRKLDQKEASAAILSFYHHVL